MDLNKEIEIIEKEIEKIKDDIYSSRKDLINVMILIEALRTAITIKTIKTKEIDNNGMQKLH